MRCSRIQVALLLIAGLLAVVPPGTAAIAGNPGAESGAPRARSQKTQGCIEKDWGYRCFYGPMSISPETGNEIDLVPAPPEAGFITSMHATLVDTKGERVPRHAAHLHHVLWGNPNRTDLTCTNYPFDQFDRFFATGKERTKLEFPAGYGYHWDAAAPPGYPDAPPTWIMAHHLMGMHEGYELDVFVRFDIGFTPASEATLTDIVPVWLDVANCTMSSEYDIARNAGTNRVHEEVWDYQMPVGGRLITLGGHLHDGGLRLRLDNTTTGEKVYVSRAVYRDDSWDLRRMTSWSGLPGKQVSAGDMLKLRSFYDTSRRRDGAMGIMIGALIPDAP